MARKEVYKAKPNLKKPELSKTHMDVLKGQGLEIAGYVEWTSPKNGDRWLNLVMNEGEREKGGQTYRVSANIPVYMVSCNGCD